MEFCKGAVVKATAGREKNKFYIIIDFFDSNHALIADGRTRRVEKPKKKKLKHLKYQQSPSDTPALTNREIRKQLGDPTGQTDIKE